MPTRQAWIFVVSVLAVSWAFEALIVARGGVGTLGPLWLVALMCIPGALALLLRLVLRLGFADAGFRAGAGRDYALAVGAPLLLALLAGVLASALEIRHFAPLDTGALAAMGAMALTVLALGLMGAAGEEIGWRGFLLPKLIAGGTRHPYLVTAVVWALWHLPLIAFGGFYRTEHPWRMAAVYGVGIVAMSFFFSALRMRSGSVWVAAVVHAAHNFFFQFGVPALLLTAPGSRAALWDLAVGDTGLAVAVLYAGAYLLLRRANGWRPKGAGAG